MDTLEKVMKEIEEYLITKDYSKEIRDFYIIEELKNKYSHLYLMAKLDIMELELQNKLLKIELSRYEHKETN